MELGSKRTRALALDRCRTVCSPASFTEGVAFQLNMGKSVLQESGGQDTGHSVRGNHTDSRVVRGRK